MTTLNFSFALRGIRLPLLLLVLSLVVSVARGEDKAETLEGLVIKLEYDMLRPRIPTDEEVLDLMCQTDRFLTERLKQETRKSVSSVGEFMDWSYDDNPDAPYAVTVTFQSEATFQDTGETVPIQDVSNSLSKNFGTAEILNYIEDYVYSVDANNIFQNTIAVNFTTYDGTDDRLVPELGSLLNGNCELPLETEADKSTTVEADNSTTVEQVTSDDRIIDVPVYTIEYDSVGFFPEPSEEEIIGLICQTTLFYRDAIRDYLDDSEIQVELNNIDFTYDDIYLKYPFALIFTANATYGNGTMVPRELVWYVIREYTAEVEDALYYIEVYVWEVEADGVLQNVSRVKFTDVWIPSQEITQTMLESVDCPFFPISTAPTMATTLWFTDETTVSPTDMSSDAIATSAPDIPSNAPSIAVSESPSMDGGFTVFLSSSDSEDYTNVRIDDYSLQFYVFNSEGIRDTVKLRTDCGLEEAWLIFAQEILRNFTSPKPNVPQRNLLLVEPAWYYEPDWAVIFDIEESFDDCLSGYVCHTVYGGFKVFLMSSNNDDYYFDDGGEIFRAANNGTLQAILHRVSPETPLVVGIPNTAIEGPPFWLILIVALVPCCCCCCCCVAACLLLTRKKDIDPDDPFSPNNQRGNKDLHNEENDVKEKSPFIVGREAGRSNEDAQSDHSSVREIVDESNEMLTREVIDEKQNYYSTPGSSLKTPDEEAPGHSESPRSGGTDADGDTVDIWNDECDLEMAAQVGENNEFAKEAERLLVDKHKDERITTEPVVIVSESSVEQSKEPKEELMGSNTEEVSGALDEDVTANMFQSEWALEAQRSLLEKGLQEDLGQRSDFEEVDMETNLNMFQNEDGYETDVSLDEGVAATVGSSEYAQESKRLLLQLGNDEKVTVPFESGAVLYAALMNYDGEEEEDEKEDEAEEFLDEFPSGDSKDT